MTYGYDEASGPSMTVRYKVIALRRIARAMQARMSTKYTTTTDVEAWADSISARFVAEMWGETVEEKKVVVPVKVLVPANWWEQLKEEHAPLWFLRRWPVKFRKRQETAVYTLSVKAVYPAFRPAVEGEEYRLIAAISDGPEELGHLIGPAYSKVLSGDDPRYRIWALERSLEAAQGQNAKLAREMDEMKRTDDWRTAAAMLIGLQKAAGSEK